MRRIANTLELSSELDRVYQVVAQPNPSRMRLAAVLRGLASRVAGDHGDASKFLFRPQAFKGEDGSIGIEINLPEFVWAENEVQARKWLEMAIRSCQNCIRSLGNLR